MLKRLRLVFLLAWTVFLWQPTWGQAASERVEAEQKRPDDRARGGRGTDTRGTKENPLVVDAGGHKETDIERQEHEKQSTKAKAEENYHRSVDRWELIWYGITAIATAVLVLVGIGSILAAFRTLRAIESQTALAKTQADIAKLSAQAVINAERPWLVVNVEIMEGEFVFRAKNVGRTPANITAIWQQAMRLNHGEVLALPDGYYNKDGLSGFTPELLPPTVDRIVGRCRLGDLRRSDSVDTWIDAANEGFAHAYHCGKVLYRDALDPAQEHETKWFYWYLPPARNFIPDPSHSEWNVNT